MENVQGPATPAQPAKPQRPTFLTVLCILTFIGSAWGIINGVSTYMNADVASSVAGEAMENAKDKIQEDPSSSESKIAEKITSGVSDLLDPAKLRKNALIQIVANVLSLLGGLLMFQLKRTGFWVYLLGVIVAVLGPVIVYGSSNLLSLGMTFVYGFFGLVFVVLYAINLKHLR